MRDACLRGSRKASRRSARRHGRGICRGGKRHDGHKRKEANERKKSCYRRERRDRLLPSEARESSAPDPLSAARAGMGRWERTAMRSGMGARSPEELRSRVADGRRSME